MNKRYVLKNDSGKLFSCVINPEKPESEQWCAIFAIEKGYGFSADRWGDQVKITDYFHGDTRAAFAIVSAEDTADEATADLTPIEG
ncbi:MAG: hypothetical protein J6J83_06630 [Oscillospiraceae bacterium]|nr:hypothetical protein [Oscillospiraceae bacterium]